MECNRDCFNCPYEDCIIDEITDEERDESNDRDIKVITENKYIARGTRGRKKVNTLEDDINTRKKYYRNNREKILVYQKEYYANRKQRMMSSGGEKKCTRCYKVVGDGYKYSLCELCRAKKRDYQRLVKERCNA